MEFDQLEKFVTFAKEGTLLKAAEVLHISQPALSRSMQNLEKDLNVTLFSRTKNKIQLNENGCLFADLAQQLLKQKNEMIEKVQRFDQKNKTFKILSCAPAPVWVLEYLLNCHFSSCSIQHTILTNEKEAAKLMQEDKIDFLVLSKNIPIKNTVAKKLMEETLYLSVPLKHPLADRDSINFKELKGMSLLLYSKIGIWNEICSKYLPDSRLLRQEDSQTFNELSKASTLPHFRTDKSLQKEGYDPNRKIIPIQEQSAKMEFYLYLKEKNIKEYHFLWDEVSALDWSKL